MTLAQVRAYFKSLDVPAWRKALVLVALGYAVMPFDAIPDVIPVIGWLDDVGVLAAVTAYLARDIRRFAAAAPQALRQST